MSIYMFNFIKLILKKMGIAVLKNEKLDELIRFSQSYYDIKLLGEILSKYNLQELEVLKKSKSQLKQDLFVLAELNFKKNGYFVEFGATNGIDLSNTYILEKEFEWTGILAEPCKSWHQELSRNRTSHIEKDCVWTNSNLNIIFNEVEQAELSTIDAYTKGDGHSFVRLRGKSYPVKTISLEHLLDKYKAPNVIDYLSIDTEGSEFEILNSFDFSKYKFRIITCEHNFTSSRNKIYDLLISKGYVRKFEEISIFDDWYINPNV